jgi:hypothetical protein
MPVSAAAEETHAKKRRKRKQFPRTSPADRYHNIDSCGNDMFFDPQDSIFCVFPFPYLHISFAP